MTVLRGVGLGFRGVDSPPKLPVRGQISSPMVFKSWCLRIRCASSRELPRGQQQHIAALLRSSGAAGAGVLGLAFYEDEQQTIVAFPHYIVVLGPA